jgi:PAS domain S-box-containing protein
VELVKKEENSELLLNIYLNIATTYQEMDKYNNALNYLNQCLKIEDNENISQDSKVLAKLNIAKLFIDSKELKKAKNELKALWPYFINKTKNSNLVIFHLTIGEYYISNNQYEEAENEFTNAYIISKQLNQNQLLIKSLEKLISIYELTGNYRNAFLYKNYEHKFIDSLKSSQNYLILSRIELEEEFEEKADMQNQQFNIKQKLHELEIDHQKKISGYLILVLVFLIGFGIYAYIVYRQKLISARVLASHRKEILVKNEALKQQMLEDKEKNELIELIDSENEILSLVAKETNNAVFIIKPDGTIEWVNEAFQRLSGFSLAEYKRVRGTKIQDASYSETIKTDFTQCLVTKKPLSYISKSFTKDNKQLWIHTTLTPVLDKNNEVERFIAIDSDITSIKQARDEIDLKNQEITASLEYARRIQKSLLPLNSEMDNIFAEYFIINLPQNIVSGDFYWAKKKNGQRLAVVADSTGHGVPGAFMSLLGISLLQEIVYKMETLDPAAILDQLREKTTDLLRYGSNELSSQESWDIAVCVINEQNELKFAGSNNSALILRDDVLIEVKPDKFYLWDEILNDKSFTLQTVQLYENDKIYLFTDGFGDQFGGLEEKKFSRRRFKKLLLDIYSLPMESQKELMNMTLKAWKGQQEQVDDIMVLGFRV